MEFRAWITVEGLEIESPEADRQHSTLERENRHLGPVSGWPASISAALASEADDKVAAAQVMYRAVTDGLSAAGLPHLYPSAVELEIAEGPY